MLILLSPAKSLDTESPVPRSLRAKVTTPRLLDDAEELVDVMRTKSPDDLRALMDISEELAGLNVERFADWHRPFDTDNARPAVLAFTGDVYLGMDPRQRFDTRDFTEAQKTVRILSGLYGVLRPLDLMQPYRLEMGTKLTTERARTLIGHWGETITKVLVDDLVDSPGPDVVVNLASQEYFSSVDPVSLGVPVVSPRFLDRTKDGSYRIVSFFAKRARGEMAAWLVTNRVRTRKAIVDFDGAGYRYDEDRSTPDEPTFVRDTPVT